MCLFVLVEAQPILSKNNASRRQNKINLFIFYVETQLILFKCRKLNNNGLKGQ